LTTLVFVEHHDGEATKASLGVLSRAAGLLEDVSACLCGVGVRSLAETVAAHGAKRVYVAEADALTEPLPQPRVDVLARLVADEGMENVLFGASVLASDVAAGLASRLEAGLNWDLVDIVIEDGRLVGKRPALQDAVLVDVGWTAPPRLALVRAGSLEPSEVGGSPEVVEVPVEVASWSNAAVMIERAHVEAEGPSIEEAEVIVAGGRGLGSPEKFELVEQLAKALGGAVGATRAVVDAGWYPYPSQVGQTGKTVSPRLYVACGVSGAIQHKVGMQGAGTIVAINKDRNAPIFDFCDLGVVGDLHQVVPKLTELVRERRGG
jgi:electron transfer flavoprotein alpha subunit